MIDIDLSPAKPQKKFDFKADDHRLFHPVTNPYGLEPEDLQASLNHFYAPTKAKAVPIDKASEAVTIIPRAEDLNTVGGKAKQHEKSEFYFLKSATSLFKKAWQPISNAIDKTFEGLQKTPQFAASAVLVLCFVSGQGLTSTFQDSAAVAHDDTMSHAKAPVTFVEKDTYEMPPSSIALSAQSAPEIIAKPVLSTPINDTIMQNNPHLPQGDTQSSGAYLTQDSSGEIQTGTSKGERQMTTYGNPAGENGQRKSNGNTASNDTNSCTSLAEEYAKSYSSRNAELVSSYSSDCLEMSGGDVMSHVPTQRALFASASVFEAVFVYADEVVMYTNTHPVTNKTTYDAVLEIKIPKNDPALG